MATRTAVLVVEDEEFTRTIVGDALAASGMDVRTAHSVAGALRILEDFEPHAVVTDLHFGPGPDGADLLAYLHSERPWVGLVVLTAHASAELAVRDGARVPDEAVYLVKSSVSSMHEVQAAIEDAIVKREGIVEPLRIEGQIVISASQAEILRLVSAGLSNSAIARDRGTTLRAVESLIQRTFSALGVVNDPDVNPRVMATQLWNQGRVVIK